MKNAILRVYRPKRTPNSTSTEKDSELHVGTCCYTVCSGTYHGRSCYRMTYAQQTLRLNPFVSYDTHNRRHEYRYNTLNCIKEANTLSETGPGQIPALTGKISSPYRELQEAEKDQFKFLCFHTASIFLLLNPLILPYIRHWLQS